MHCAAIFINSYAEGLLQQEVDEVLTTVVAVVVPFKMKTGESSHCSTVPSHDSCGHLGLAPQVIASQLC